MTRWKTKRLRPRPRCGHRAMNSLRLSVVGAVLCGLSSCLGPNPGFFISTSAANATISTLVGSFVEHVLGQGGD